ncbi:apoptosis-associated speck-like protein containing a CARD [Rhineura floridana]|uniref:apoptosis-associated speck-like protein containing a CARD n=1 Tax=Rhineura floridana TaxID=261503 RepID=UPI002AC873F3|nr:apoptosis-associated speck-like protein containing a CARD [Rhineura floridana]
MKCFAGRNQSCEELKFQRLHADQLQQYIELYAWHMQDELELNLMEKSKDELVWEASIARDELNSSHPTQGASGCIQTRAQSINTASEMCEACPPFSPELHFIDQHREELIRWTTDIEGVLDLLLGTTMNEEQYQKISLKGTNPEKMRELYRLVPSWNNTGKDWLYKALKAKHKFLVADLEER